MNFPVPRIITTSYALAIERGCDCVMLKHDGFPVTLNCVSQLCTITAAIPHLEPTEIDSVTLIDPLDALLIGAKSRTSPTIYIHDCWWMHGIDLQKQTYRERYSLARANVKFLDERFRMVTTYPVSAAPSLWTEVAKNPQEVKGLVFRRSKDPAAGDLYVVRYYAENPEGLA